MSEDITAQNIAAIKESPWHAIQRDESTDIIASCAQLIIWVRFIKDGDFFDESLMCKSLETTTKGQDIFPKIDALARDPFSAPLYAITDEDITEEELVRLKQDSGAKALFQSASLHSFWCKMLQSYSCLSEKVIWLLMPYPSTYLCEQSFSTMVVMKTKHRNRLEIEKDMIVALSSTKHWKTGC